MHRSELYTALSRGRYENHAYAICDTDSGLAHGQTGRPPTPIEVLTRVTQRERPDWPHTMSCDVRWHSPSSPT